MPNQNPHRRLFADVADRFARTVGQSDIHINFSNEYQVDQNAESQGNHVNMPYIPPGSTMSDGEFMRLNGYLDHETAKLRYSDDDFWSRHREEMTEEGHEWHAPLTSIFESVRIENEYLMQYPGARKFLDLITTDMNGYKIKQVRKHIKTGMDLAKILIIQEVYKHRDIELPVVDDDLANYDILKPLIDMIDDIDISHSTEDVYELVQRILGYLEDNKDEIENQVPDPDFGDQDNDDQDGEGDGGEGEGDSITIVVIVSKAFNKSKGMVSLVNKINAENGNVNLVIIDLDGDGEERITQGDIALNPEGNNKANPEETTDAEMEDGEIILPPYSTKYDRVFCAPGADLQQYQHDSRYMKSQTAHMQRATRMMLLSRDKTSKARGLEDGKLDFDRLVEMGIGQNDVFYEKSMSARINTDVLLLVDLSGSMPEETTRRAAISLTDCLANVRNVHLAVVGFTTGDENCAYSLGRRDQEGVGRIHPLYMPMFLDFNTAYYVAKKNLGAIHTENYTPLGEAMGLCLEKLTRRPTPRKMLWIVSDGHPAFPTGDYRHSEYKLLDMCKRTARRLSIETVGIAVGWGADYLGRYVDISTTLESADDLSSQFIKLAREHLSITRKS